MSCFTFRLKNVRSNFSFWTVFIGNCTVRDNVEENGGEVEVSLGAVGYLLDCAEVTLYEGDNCDAKSITLQKQEGNFPLLLFIQNVFFLIYIILTPIKL